jgi:hypothetical protein
MVVEERDKLSRIHPHGGCQTPHFVLAFAYAQTSHPHLFPAPDDLLGVVFAILSRMEVNDIKIYLRNKLSLL